ncbi:hypothetical protein FIC_01746 [Flavobacteriaceae bacterium 3519-10]|nr:hypothetical protein FIC_01746 [Flavobacteriaceae bacterium 3519-10]
MRKKCAKFLELQAENDIKAHKTTLNHAKKITV